ncbi:MAG: 3-phenylpropionate/cinnamic acid dioxygenase subunit beta [Chloroflexota bacterium]
MSAAPVSVSPVPLNLALWFEALTWLDHEADLLDTGRFDEWLKLLDDDVRYTVPVRLTRERGGGADTHAGSPHFLDDIGTLRMRVQRLESEFAWAEDPPSRTRRFVTNVRPQPTADGVDVRSYLLLYRNRGEDVTAELISAERHDHLRRAADGNLKLLEREVRLDQSTLGVRNLAVML